MMQLPNIKKTIPTLLLLILLLGSATFPASAQSDGQNNPGVTLVARAGFDGFYKQESWIPVHITVANNGPAVEGELRIAMGSVAAGTRIVYNSPISLPTQSNKRVTLFVFLPAFTSSLTIELLDSDERLISQTNSNKLSQLAADDLLYGVVSPDPGELDYLENVTGGRSDAAVSFLDVTDLPQIPAAWNTLDILVFNDIDTGQLTAAQLQALKGWVSTGGQLVVTGGPGWQKTAVSLTDMLPVAISGSESIADLPALSGRTGVPFRDPGPYLVTTSSLRSGELIYHQDGLPLLARQSWGRGAVHFLALDPQLAPLLDWDGSEVLWAEVANQVPTLPSWATGVKNPYAAGSAVTALPSLALPSVIQLIIFLLIYIIIIGPVNYLILKRLNRRELAWATIPVLVIFFSATAYGTGFQLKGNDTIINQMSIAYGQVGSDQMRVQSLVGLYSPRRTTYDLILPAASMARPFDREYGGLDNSGNFDAITRGNDLIITGVLVNVSDFEIFAADSYQFAPNISGQATLNLNGTDIQLDATIQNNSDIMLENATLLLGTIAIPLGDLMPGDSQSVSEPIGTAVSATSPTIPSSGVPIPVIPPGAFPLTNNAEAILGTNDYYNDRDAYPRWQLLQALDSDYYRGSSPPATTTPTNDIVTLIAWSDQTQLDTAVNRDEYTNLGTTLYFLELPLTQNIVSGNNISIPTSLLNWSVLGESGVYEAAIQNLYLNGGWVEFEYTPWPEFQSMQISTLAVVVEPQINPSVPSAPEIRLWDWQQEIWVTIKDADWGITSISDANRFIGPGNAVRIRLQDNSNYNTEIREVYPFLTGNLQ